jgi:hypothetical protein
MITDRVKTIVSGRLRTRLANVIGHEGIVSEERYRHSPPIDKIHEACSDNIWAWFAMLYHSRKISAYVGLTLTDGCPQATIAFAGMDRDSRDRLQRSLRSAALAPNWDGFTIDVSTPLKDTTTVDEFDHKLEALINAAIAAMENDDPFRSLAISAQIPPKLP